MEVKKEIAIKILQKTKQTVLAQYSIRLSKTNNATQIIPQSKIKRIIAKFILWGQSHPDTQTTQSLSKENDF